MPRNPIRDVPSGTSTLWEFTKRTQESRMLLRPDGLVEQICLGLMERCRRKTPGLSLHLPAFQSNHYHLLASVDGPRCMARFTNLYHSLVARVLNRYLGRSDAFWAKTLNIFQVLPEAEVSRAEYLAGQGLALGLYARAHHNPCAHAIDAVTRGEPLTGLDVDIKGWFRALKKDPKADLRRFTRKITVRLDPLPCMADLSVPQQQAAWRDIVRDAEAKGAAVRQMTPNQKLFGAEAMRAVDPSSKPKHTKRGGRAPRCVGPAAACKAWHQRHLQNLAQRDAANEHLAAHLPHAGLPDSMHPPAALVCAARRLARGATTVRDG